MSDVRLILGDCLEAMKSLESGSVDAVITDPPYGCYSKAALSNAYAGKAQMWDEAVDADFHDQWLREARRVVKDTAPIFVFMSPMRIEHLAIPFKKHFRLQNVIAWNYRNNNKMCFTDDRLKMCWEAVLYGFVKGGGVPIRKRVMSDVWEYAQPQSNFKDKRVHPAQKPIALMARMVELGTNAGDTILDPFAGSGTTLIAAMRTGRNGIGIEQDAEYYAIAEKRVAEAKAEYPLFAEAGGPG